MRSTLMHRRRKRGVYGGFTPSSVEIGAKPYTGKWEEKLLARRRDLLVQNNRTGISSSPDWEHWKICFGREDDTVMSVMKVFTPPPLRNAHAFHLQKLQAAFQCIFTTPEKLTFGLIFKLPSRISYKEARFWSHLKCHLKSHLKYSSVI